MSEKIIRRFAVYPVWEYEQEVIDLNNLSRQGIQLTLGGCFQSLFRYDNTVRYIYQLDYQPNIIDKPRYLEMYEAQDWEYINSTFNGWHYFRKPYREGMSEEESLIYTDQTSLHEMQNRYARLLLFCTIYMIFSGFFCLCRAISGSSLALGIESIAAELLAICTGYGVYATRCRQQGRPVPFRLPARVLLPLCILLLILSVILQFIV